MASRRSIKSFGSLRKWLATKSNVVMPPEDAPAGRDREPPAGWVPDACHIEIGEDMPGQQLPPVTWNNSTMLLQTLHDELVKQGWGQTAALAPPEPDDHTEELPGRPRGQGVGRRQ